MSLGNIMNIVYISFILDLHCRRKEGPRYVYSCRTSQQRKHRYFSVQRIGLLEIIHSH